MSTFEAAHELLQQGNENGNVFDHVTGIVVKILQDRPSDALSAFENISLVLKSSSAETHIAGPATKDVFTTERASLARKTLENLNQIGSAENIEGVQNLYSDTLLLDWAGICFSQEEIFTLQQTMSIIVLQQQETEDPVLNVRFWGKLLGCRGVDYSVFECECSSEVEVPENLQPGMEGREGVNKYTYFVLCNGVVSKLPHLTEQHIALARQTKKLLTGDLSVEVSGYPPFPGREAHYVRALIALISADTKVAPQGFFGRDEESDEILSKFKATDDLPEALKSQEVDDLACWTHFELSINGMGRMTAAPQVENADGDLEPDKRYEAAENATVRDALGTLQDESEEWMALKYSVSSGTESVGVLKSVRWPGAVAVASAGKLSFVNCYVGYGCKSSDVNYTPPALPSLQSEYGNDITEQIDNIDVPVVEADAEEED